MNEPDNNFGPSPCSQEGMEVDPNQVSQRLLTLFSPRFPLFLLREKMCSVDHDV